jgi:hypothetical protein
MATSTLDKISNSSKEYFINGNFNFGEDGLKNIEDYFCPEKKSFNKLLHSKSVSDNLKMKFNEFYKGFFQKENLNINKLDTSEMKNNLDNYKYKKVYRNYSNNNNKLNNLLNNYENYNNNINLVVKRKLLYDYIKREKKENIFNNENKLSRKLNRMNKINNNNDNNINIKNNYSFILISNKIFGNDRICTFT